MSVGLTLRLPVAVVRNNAVPCPWAGASTLIKTAIGDIMGYGYKKYGKFRGKRSGGKKGGRVKCVKYVYYTR